jgi:hypothetical protein
MADMAQIDRIVTEIGALKESEKVILFQKIEELLHDHDDGEISIESAFGLWKDREIDKESLRKKAWGQS